MGSVSRYSKLLNPRRGLREPLLINKSDKSVGNLETHYSRLASRGE